MTAFGLGCFSFGFLRLVLLSIYSDSMVWFVFWEEATELFFIAGIGLVIIIFKKALLIKHKSVK